MYIPGFSNSSWLTDCKLFNAVFAIFHSITVGQGVMKRHGIWLKRFDVGLLPWKKRLQKQDVHVKALIKKITCLARLI